MRAASVYTIADTMRISNMYQIPYSSEQAFYDGCYEMMKRGACYMANHHSLTITLTGGY